MSKNPQDRNRVPGQGEGEDLESMPGKNKENMPRKEGGEQNKGQQGQQGQTGGQGGQQWNKDQGMGQGQQGQQGGQRQQGDPMNRQRDIKDTDEQTGDDKKKRPA
jgi:hypothetical protein